MFRIIFSTILGLGASLMSVAQQNPENLGPIVNTNFAELRPTVSADGNKMFFVVEGNPSNLNYKKDKKAQDVWYTEKDASGNWKQATPCQSPINEQKNNGVFWMSANNDTILIRGAYENGKLAGKGFSYSTRTASGWSAPTRLVMEGYSALAMDQFSGLTMNIDGNVMFLYFSEEKNNPINNIYISKRNADGSWAKPTKLSNQVNTDDYDEIAPFLAADNQTLYFSSNRPGGVGDYDIWMTKRTDDTWTKWSEPQNMGEKINSAMWEGYFALEANGKNAYFASSNKAEGKTDLFKIALEPWQQAVPYVDLNVALLTSKTQDTLSEATVTIAQFEGADTTGKMLEVKNKQFTTKLEYGKKYLVKSVADAYKETYDTLDLSMNGQSKTISKLLLMNEKIDSAKLALLDSNLKFTDSSMVFQDDEGNLVLPPSIKDSGSIENMNKLVKGDTVSINNILFDFAKSELRPEAIRELNKIKEMMKAFPKLELDISAFTDDIGSEADNLKLSVSRAETAKKYLVEQGVDPEKIKVNGYGESKPIDTNATEIGRQKNRRVVFKLNKNQ